MNPIRTITVVTALALVSPLAALGHDTHEHGGKAPRYDYSKAEETPFGIAADPAKASRVVKLTMDDTMRYTPNRITVKRGESVRFVATNRGKLLHEVVLGTPRDLEAHAAMMRKHPGMEHDEPNMLHVAPGKTGEMGWRFTKAGEFQFGCLVAGHFEAGMVGKVVVTEAKPNASWVSGEVRRVDKEAGKITLKHQAIPNLDMTAMTMVFTVKDRAMLESVRPGDKVEFKADNVGGALTVTEIRATR